MSPLTQDGLRVIISDFVTAIEERKIRGPKPQTCVINFRNEQSIGFERDMWLVPIELLRFRKDNGRIASDVMNYEKYKGVLDEKSKESQDIIKDFLKKKDPEKTEELIQSILHADQKDPAIITCDGFLINGNRRLMVLHELVKKDQKFAWMKVVILPKKGDLGGPPTVKEIEQIENRYQLQSDGKSEYTAFDMALSIRRKINAGISLEDQLKDDPTTAGLNSRELDQRIRAHQKKYLDPLTCIDQYLDHFNRPGLYGTIASGVGDPEGRWQAFVDYASRLNEILSSPEGRKDHRIDEREIGRIKDLTFKIIRKRSFPELPKLHMIIRDLPKLISNPDAKKELLKITDVDASLPEGEKTDAKGRALDEREIDRIWGEKNATDLIRQVKKAVQIHAQLREREKPIDLLIGALNKLNNENMDISAIDAFQLDEAMGCTEHIVRRAEEIGSEIDHYRMSLQNLKKRNAKK